MASNHFLEKFFNPQSVAIVGASNNPARINRHLVANPVNLGFKGRIYPVNPNEKEIMGLKAYASVLEIGETVDLAVISVSNSMVPKVLAECAEKGIKLVSIVSGGFSETGGKGIEVQKEMEKLIRDNGMRVVGPNALSPLNVENNFYISFFAIQKRKKGHLSMIFQSGLYEPRLDWFLSDYNFHFNKIIDLGNKMDITEVEALSYLIHDPGTRVIGVHMESIAGDGREFLGLLKEAAEMNKPVVVLKSGITEAGMRGAASHTGALTQGNNRVLDGALAQAGAIRCYNLDDFFNTTRALERLGPVFLQGNRVFVASLSGGEGVIVSDTCERKGFRLTRLSESTLDKVKPVFPPLNISTNFWDLGVTLQFGNVLEIYKILITSIVEDPNFDALVVQIVPGSYLLPDDFFDVFRLARRRNKPVVLWLPGVEPGRYEVLERVEEDGVPIFPSAEKAIDALQALYRFSRFQDRID